MLKHFFCLLVMITVVAVVMILPGCGTTPTDNTTGGHPTPTPTPPPSGSSLTIIKTGIPTHVQAKIAAGDDLVVYGTGQNNANQGVDYIVPSAGDTAGRGITNGENYLSYSFALAGKKIALVDTNFQVTIFDTVSKTTSTVAVTDVRLARIPVGWSSGGHIRGSVNYVATINDPGEVSDGKVLKVIDVSGSSPAIVTFTGDTFSSNDVNEVAVEGNAKKVAAATADKIMVFDIANPTANPQTFDISGKDGISTDIQMHFSGGYILYVDGAAFANARLLNITSGANTVMTNKPASGVNLALLGGKFGYFDSNKSIGNDLQSVIGSVTSAPGGTAAATGSQIDGSTDNNGWRGFAQTIGVTPDGARWFIAGFDGVGQGEYLQTSTGGGFTVLQSANSGDAWGFPATDVSCSSNTVAFKGGQQQDTVVCYIKLQ